MVVTIKGNDRQCTYNTEAYMCKNCCYRKALHILRVCP